MRSGFICGECFGSFPESIQKNIIQFNARQLTQAKNLYTAPTVKPWLKCGRFGLTHDAVQLNMHEYPLQKLRGIRLGFHPYTIGSSPNTVSGTVTLILETENPYMIIEEPFLEHNITARYNINGLLVNYFFSSELSRMVQEVETAIKNGVYNLERFMEEYSSRQEQQEKEAQEKAREEGRKSQKSRQKQTKKNEQSATPLEKARIRFGLEMPYSAEQLKRARNKILIKEPIHPDNGGSAEAFKKFEEEYRLLLKYATKVS